jgi:hypothetical protein
MNYIILIQFEYNFKIIFNLLFHTVFQYRKEGAWVQNLSIVHSPYSVRHCLSVSYKHVGITFHVYFFLILRPYYKFLTKHKICVYSL